VTPFHLISLPVFLVQAVDEEIEKKTEEDEPYDEELAAEPEMKRKPQKGRFGKGALACRIPLQEDEEKLEAEGEQGPAGEHYPDESDLLAHETWPGTKKIDPVVLPRFVGRLPILYHLTLPVSMNRGNLSVDECSLTFSRLPS
jgi:hypothetical protein